MKIPYLPLLKITQSFEPHLSQAVKNVIDSGWYLLGEETARFESQFAQYCGVSDCVGVGNGLDALKIILMSMKLQHDWAADDEVIVPAHTFIASAEGIVHAGLRPVFCDVSEDDGLLDPAQVEKSITDKTRAIMAVHLYGKVVPMDAIREIAQRHHLKVIEDAAQAHGATDASGRRAGSLADAAAFSFYPGKNLGCLGDGGAILTQDKDLAMLCRQVANYGQTRKYVHDTLGVNSRMDEIQASVLSVKLTRLDKDNAYRRNLARLYLNGIQHPEVKLPHGGKYDAGCVYHIFPVFSERRDALQSWLAQNGIETLIHYPIPPHRQRSFAAWDQAEFPVAQRMCRTELSLPLHPCMTQEDVLFVIDKINQFSC
ncbi:MAG: DegT/DnrJ/EryC1/StrS family aminotransferase [Bacteroidaceae bacterium]|nr:DegT/DnrJ/EryC1/StrS family aminotransferase [Bacteroidaceae bacterium]